MIRPLREARIDLAAISANVETLRRIAGTEFAMAVVKADGYGHGAVQSARAALDGGADCIGVADASEAFALRAAGITAPLLAWLHNPESTFDAELAAGIELGVSYAEQLERVAAAGGRASAPARVHLKLDTGLGRNGVETAGWESIFTAAAEHERRGRIRVVGVFSHLSGTSRADDLAQVAEFERAAEMAESAGLVIERRHLAATAGAIRVPESRFDMVRLGVGIYGLSPFDDTTAAELGLRPAMELSAAVISVKRVPANTPVSYNYTYRTPGESTLALVPLGYGDGISRHASGKGPVMIAGQIYPVAGRVAMDQLVVDVGDDPVSIGDRAVLFGDPATGAPSAEDWAAAAGTINYEIVTRIGGRVERSWS
ncbi:MAG: alanine racemase [Homoserinimonas sp.]